MPTKRLSLFILFVVYSLSLSAQGFCVEGVFGSPRRGAVQLVVVDSVAGRRTWKVPVRDGRFVIEGTVDRPVLAELRHSSLAQPLRFYLENSPIRIAVNDQQPARSRVSGSRSNSEYRLVAEQWDEQPDYTSPYAPLVLLQRGVDATLPDAFDRLSGAACQSPQYRVLRQRVERLRSTQEGSPLPHFVFLDSARRPVASDSLLCDSCWNLLFFGAAYCGPCEQARRQLQQLAADRPTLHAVVCQLDDDPAGWDAAWVDSLAIDHIPYLLLVDGQGRIVERDLRIWELERTLKTASATSASSTTSATSTTSSTSLE